MDKEYWDRYYKEHGSDKEISNQSSFATFCQEELFKNKNLKILELGCGNGRDAIYFVRQGHNVIALDQSLVAIEVEKNKLSLDLNTNLLAKTDNFVTEDYSIYGNLDVFYSRFTMHAIKQEEEDIVLSKVYEHLATKGLFCIEVRTTKDSLYGIGENLGNNTYFTDHTRRFIDSNKFLNKVLYLGFKLRYFNEKNNLSVYKDDNPVLMRIILEK